MKVEFHPLTADLLPACVEFNRRLREKTDEYFTLPEHLNTKSSSGSVQLSYSIAVDDTGTVRGGVLLQDLRGWIGGQELPLTNIQSPITEGVVDRRYAGVAFQMLRFLEARSPCAYAVGMGSAENPFARLLKAAGWSISAVPFFISVERAGRALSELPMLQRGRKRLVASVLAQTGLADAAAAVWRMSRGFKAGPGVRLDRVSDWPADAVDRVWQECRDGMAFSGVRDAAGVSGLHPASQARLLRYSFSEADKVTGWSAALLTQMNGSSHFGNLRVGTILDALVSPADRIADLLALTRQELRAAGADVLVANQVHASWAEPLRRLGFIERPSNYMLAMSKTLRKTTENAAARVYVSRADGDGRLNL